MNELFGKYRAKVASEKADPHGLGRIEVNVPSVFGKGVVWAMPSVPYAADGKGLLFLPPKGANVWVEFEEGHIDGPIWSGGFWGPAKAPGSLRQKKILKTDQVTITIDDASGALLLESSLGIRIECGTGGITIENGKNAKITLTGPTVGVNGDALEVT